VVAVIVVGTQLLLITFVASQTPSRAVRVDTNAPARIEAMATHAIVAAAGVAAVGALCAYFLWPAALAGAATMKASGAGRALISRAAF
jgi:hypothetical protein